MSTPEFLFSTATLAPAILMLAVATFTAVSQFPTSTLWRVFLALSWGALVVTGVNALLATSAIGWPGMGWLGTSLLESGWLGVTKPTLFGLVLATLVQLLGTVIGGFSVRYLQGDAQGALGQRRYIAALAAVLAAVHWLLLADHWILLIGAWTAVGFALQQLLCFYPDRPFALLAAHKKRVADRVADALLVMAAVLAWSEVGSGSLSTLAEHVARQGMSTGLQISAVVLVLAVILRTALLPVHGWLIQVMEAPTPVSALLHAGVINLGCFVLIRFSVLLEHATTARLLLLAFGLATAMLAGMVMLTRISIKVKLAWSTAAQMGFMLLECGLGLYTLAALHLVGHSLYKAHAFLGASDIVRQTRIRSLQGAAYPSVLSLVVAPLLAPLLTISLVSLTSGVLGYVAWPWWWSLVLGLAWAPLLWIPINETSALQRAKQAGFGLFLVVGLTLTAMLAHALPLGITDSPQLGLGLIALVGMAALYLCQAVLQHRPEMLSRWRRWSYAGFYADEAYTRFALRFWPVQWNPEESKNTDSKSLESELANIPR